MQTTIVKQKAPARKAQEKMTKLRNEVTATKRSAGKLGPKTEAYIPDDIEIMFAGKTYQNLTKASVANTNEYKAFLREYKGMTTETEAHLKGQFGLFEDQFKSAKKHLTKITERHPLWAKFKDVKGFSATQLGLIMSLIKDPYKFASPSKLMVYAGVGTYYGINVNKMNLNKIKEEAANRGRKFNGFNTQFSGKLEVVIDCLMRSKGWFYDFYTRKKEQKIAQARNEGRVFVATKDDVKASKVAAEKDDERAEIDEITGEPKVAKMEAGKEYMVGKKNQSLISYADRAAKNTMKNILLHLIYAEWWKLKGGVPRNPYVFDYLGHQSWITLDEICGFDNALRSKGVVDDEQD